MTQTKWPPTNPGRFSTHNGYKEHPGDLLTLANGIRRDLILVDERPDDIDVAEFTLGDFEQLHGLCLTKLKLDEGEEPLLTQALVASAAAPRPHRV